MLLCPQAQQAAPASAARAAGAFYKLALSVEAVLRAALVAHVGSDDPWCAQLACWPASVQCETVGCDRNAHYNFISDGRPRFCREHREEGMVRAGRPSRLLLLRPLYAQSWLWNTRCLFGERYARRKAARR